MHPKPICNYPWPIWQDFVHLQRITAFMAKFMLYWNNHLNALLNFIYKISPGADAIKKFTPSLGIPSLGV